MSLSGRTALLLFLFTLSSKIREQGIQTPECEPVDLKNRLPSVSGDPWTDNRARVEDTRSNLETHDSSIVLVEVLSFLGKNTLRHRYWFTNRLYHFSMSKGSHDLRPRTPYLPSFPPFLDPFDVIRKCLSSSPPLTFLRDIVVLRCERFLLES